MFALTWTVTWFCFRNSFKKTHLKAYPPPLHQGWTLINFLEECLQEKGHVGLVELRHWKSSSSGFVNTDFIKQVSLVPPRSETLHHPFTDGRFVAAPLGASLWVSFFHQHLLSLRLCHVLVILTVFQALHQQKNISTPWKLRWWSTFFKHWSVF